MFDHLNALRIGLNHEKARLANAKKAGEVAARTVWVRGYEKEIAFEIASLAKKGIVEPVEAEMTDDELLAELMA